MNYQVNTVTVVNNIIPNSDNYVLYTAGEVTGVVIGVVLVIMGLLIILLFAIVITLKLKNDRHQCVIRNLKSEMK